MEEEDLFPSIQRILAFALIRLVIWVTEKSVYRLLNPLLLGFVGRPWGLYRRRAHALGYRRAFRYGRAIAAAGDRKHGYDTKQSQQRLHSHHARPCHVGKCTELPRSEELPSRTGKRLRPQVRFRIVTGISYFGWSQASRAAQTRWRHHKLFFRRRSIARYLQQRPPPKR